MTEKQYKDIVAALVDIVTNKESMYAARTDGWKSRVEAARVLVELESVNHWQDRAL